MNDPLAAAVIEAIHTGDVDGLRRLLHDVPDLATVQVGDDRASRTLLHVVADWPGHFPRGAATVAALVEAGADVDARFVGRHRETPLHWAASSDDVAVLDALLVAGADIDADGGVIAGSTPLADATAFGQWNAARRLVERGARTNAMVTPIWRNGSVAAAADLPTRGAEHSATQRRHPGLSSRRRASREFEEVVDAPSSG